MTGLCLYGVAVILVCADGLRETDSANGGGARIGIASAPRKRPESLRRGDGLEGWYDFASRGLGIFGGVDDLFRGLTVRLILVFCQGCRRKYVLGAGRCVRVFLCFG